MMNSERERKGKISSIITITIMMMKVTITKTMIENKYILSIKKTVMSINSHISPSLSLLVTKYGSSHHFTERST